MKKVHIVKKRGIWRVIVPFNFSRQEPNSTYRAAMDFCGRLNSKVDESDLPDGVFIRRGVERKIFDLPGYANESLVLNPVKRY